MVVDGTLGVQLVEGFDGKERNVLTVTGYRLRMIRYVNKQKLGYGSYLTFHEIDNPHFMQSIEHTLGPNCRFGVDRR